MNNYDTIITISEGKTGTIVLNRPAVHNAMNAKMISELRDAIRELSSVPDLRAILIRGEGKSFCSGADLNYMKEQASMSREENFQDALNLASLFREIYTSALPVLTLAHGNVTGGANGIIAASDYALCSHDTQFRFSEVLLGLVPATIAPYVLDRVGRALSIELMLTGKTFTGKEAEAYGLVNKSADASQLDEEMENIMSMILRGGPDAIKNIRKLVKTLSLNPAENDLLTQTTAHFIADARASDEGKEGIASFFEKRKPNWSNEGI